MSVYVEPYRNLFGCIAHNRNDELGKWVTLSADLNLNRYGGAIVGYDGTGKIVLANAAVTLGKVLGWANRSVDKQLYKTGEQMHIVFDNEVTYQLPVDGATPAAIKATIAAMKLGQTFALKVVMVNGEPVQKVDPAGAANDHLVSILDTDQPGRDYVRVRIIPGKINMA